MLSKQLVSCLIAEPLAPLASETILLESPAMSHWLTKQIAIQTGIAANIEYPFPAALIWQVYRRLMPNLPERSSFDRLSLSLRLFSLLKALSAQANNGEQSNSELNTSNDAQALGQTSVLAQLSCSSLADYCQGVNNPQDLFVLANHIAGLYDQYQIYRPDWLKHWAKNKSALFSPQSQELADWQSVLWQWLTQLTQVDEDPDRATIFDQAMHMLDDMVANDPIAKHTLFDDLPRLHCFALSNLPSSYLLLIEKLSHWVDVIIYALNPSVHFWQNCLSQRQRIQQSVKTMSLIDNENSSVSVISTDTVLQSSGNELLIQLAKQQQSYLAQLIDLKSQNSQECFIELAENNLLEKLQNSITKLEQYEQPKVLAHLDDSIAIHSCHNRLREVEVVQQHILQVLDDNPSWQTGDIAIIVPDVDSYAPYFHAVFGGANTLDNPYPLLHYAVSEKNSQKTQCLFQAVTKFLNLIQSSFTHSQVLDFFTEPCVYEYFGLSQSQLSTAEALISQCNVRFGLAASESTQKSSDTFGSTFNNTVVDLSFSQAKQRLLQSFYLAESVNHSDDILSPLIPHIEHERAAIAGSLCEFIDQLALCVTRFNQKIQDGQHSVNVWSKTLLQCVKGLMKFEGDYDEQAALLLKSIQTLDEQAALAAYSDKNINSNVIQNIHPTIDIAIFKLLLEDNLSSSAQNFYYSETAINIASFLPMQSVPFKMIAVLGMNDGEFPVIPPKDQLDLMQHQSRLGDRNKVDDQRGQFLQCILSVREKLFISYLGRNQYDNTEQFPSLLLKELIQFLDNNYCFNEVDTETDTKENKKKLSEFLIKQHALQSFDPMYFNQIKHSDKNGILKEYCLPSLPLSSNQFKLIEAQALVNATLSQQSFYQSNTMPDQIALDTELSNNVSLKALAQALSNPSRALLKQQGIFLSSEQLINSDTELFSPTGLSDYQLRTFKFEQVFSSSDSIDKPSSHHDEKYHTEAFIRQGLLPQSYIGQLALNNIDNEVAACCQVLKDHHLNICNQTINFELQLSTEHFSLVNLSCSIDWVDLDKGQVLAVVCKKLRGKHLLTAFLTHLCLSIYQQEKQQAGEQLSKSIQSYLLSTEGLYKFPSMTIDEAKNQLAFYLDEYQSLLNKPCLFFVNSSYDYLTKLVKGEEAAEKQFSISLMGSDRSRGEIEDEYHQYLLRGSEPLFTTMLEKITLLTPAFDQLISLSGAESSAKKQGVKS